MENTIWNAIAKHIAQEATEDDLRLLRENFGDTFTEHPVYREALYSWQNVQLTRREYNKQRIRKLMQSKISNGQKLQRQHTFRRLTSYAASVLLLVALSVIAWLAHHQEYVITNPQVANKTFTLPDGSEIILKQGAVLSYSQSVFTGFDREVKLHGQAYFHVQSTPDRKQFKVFTPQAHITVLGTKFNVIAQHQITHVSLAEGKVSIGNQYTREPVLMRPGQTAISRNGQAAIELGEANPEVFSAWTRNRLELDNFTLEEIVELLQVQYNYKIKLANDSLKHKHIFGSAPSNEPELLIEALEIMLKKKFERHNDTILINN